jgi:hypothetical protein
MLRDDICMHVSLADHARLKVIVKDRNSKAKHDMRARIVLATADGHGTSAIMRQAKASTPSVWCWQERYAAEGVDGVLHDRARLARKPPLSPEAKLAVLTKTNEQPPSATHWSGRMMAKAVRGLLP